MAWKFIFKRISLTGNLSREVPRGLAAAWLAAGVFDTVGAGLRSGGCGLPTPAFAKAKPILARHRTDYPRFRCECSARLRRERDPRQDYERQRWL